jgi:predicted O-linked N-acetylglucosamine transferase (SPINDLY family)
MQRKIKDNVDFFIDVSKKSSKEIASLARSHGIDIAIDENVYTTYSRHEIFSYRPGKIQLSFLAFAGTSGSAYLDYIIADKKVISETLKQFYSEKIAYMPDCYMPTDNTRTIAHTEYKRSDFGLPDDKFVFCSFNNNKKIQPAMYKTWIEILKVNPSSVLWLLFDNTIAETNLKKQAMFHGIDPARVIFSKKTSPEEHLARHALADLFLDTYPCGAHTTATEALQMDLPLITLAGDSFASRVAASVLFAIGLDELVTFNVTEYRELAIKLSLNPKKIESLKNKIKENKKVKPLFNTSLYTKNLEKIFKIMWERNSNNKIISDIYLD